MKDISYKPLVSVILPVFNGEQFLATAIDSVLGQSFENWELIIIDDGSKDSSPFICDSYQNRDERIRVFHQENGGVNAARAKGVDNASGEYLTFLDADDSLYPDALDYMISQFSEGVDLVAFGSKDGKVTRDDYVCGLWSGLVLFGLCTKMFRTTLFKQMHNTLDHKLVMGEDLLLNSVYAINLDSAYIFTQKVYKINYENEKSATHTFKHNWEYEKFYFHNVEELFLKHIKSWDSFSKIQLLVNKSWLNAIKYTMLDGGKVNYDDVEFKHLEQFFSKHKETMGPSEEMIFLLKNSFLYRLILNLYLAIKQKTHLW